MLSASLSATPTVDGVDLALSVSNDGDEPVTLRFRTGQRADFAAHPVDETTPIDGSDRVNDLDGSDAVWRHGAGRLFTQVLGSETLEPGESVTYEATWPDSPSGTHRLVGRLTAEESEIRATATVTVD